MVTEESIRALTFLPKCHLLLFGWCEPAYEARLNGLISSLGLTKRVHFLGEVSSGNKWSYFSGVEVGLVLYRPDSLRTQMQAFASNKSYRDPYRDLTTARRARVGADAAI